MLHYGDADLSFSSFYNKLLYHLDEMAPLKKLTLKEFRLSLKPWITNEILTKIKERDKLIKNIKNENDPGIKTTLVEKYKLLRNEITVDKQKSKKAHFAAYFEKNKLKSADVWKGIRQLVF